MSKKPEVTPRPEPVRSLAEIRGQYGLDEPFQVLAEGPRDRKTGTVVGRQQRAPAKKLVPVAQAVMGTARLEVPREVHARSDDPPEIPLYPMRWWPLLAGALITPGIIIAVAMSGGDPVERPTPPAGDGAEPVSSPTAPAPLRPPDRPPGEVQSPHRVAPRAPKTETPAQPSASASVRAPARNSLPDFPNLEDP